MIFTIRSFIGTRNEQQDNANVILDERGLFAVLCDGMGGRKHGGSISRTVVEELCFRYMHTEMTDFIHFMTKQTDEIDKKIGEVFRNQGGTTLVSAFIDDDGCFSWFSLGDSRLYLINDRQCEQITDDHNYYSILEDQLAKGMIDEQIYEKEARRGKALTSFLGINGISLISSGRNPIKLTDNDTLLLTSDGLYNALSSDMIAETISAERNPENAADRLIDLVRNIKDTAIDNTTFILIRNGV